MERYWQFSEFGCRHHLLSLTSVCSPTSPGSAKITSASPSPGSRPATSPLPHDKVRHLFWIFFYAKKITSADSWVSYWLSALLVTAHVLRFFKSSKMKNSSYSYFSPRTQIFMCWTEYVSLNSPWSYTTEMHCFQHESHHCACEKRAILVVMLVLKQ